VVPPTEPCALRSTKPLKVSTRDFSWGKGCRCVWLTTYHPCSAETSRKSGTLILALGPPRPVAGDLYLLPCILYTVSYFNQQSTIYTRVGTFAGHLCFIYLLTPCGRALLEELTGLHLLKKFPAFYGTQRFITAFTCVRHLSLS